LAQAHGYSSGTETREPSVAPNGEDLAKITAPHIHQCVANAAPNIQSKATHIVNRLKSIVKLWHSWLRRAGSINSISTTAAYRGCKFEARCDGSNGAEAST
jgi:hypothetical protein